MDRLHAGRITLLMTCDGIALLPGWENSQGAVIEQRIGEWLGLTVKTIDEWLTDE
jgi:hypothetical protein